MSPAPSMSALATHALSKRFGSLVVAADISIELPQGARHALIGPNGAGKTTLINMLTGMLRPDAGRIELAGEDITHANPASRVRRGLVRTFQINTLFPSLTALETVTLAVLEREIDRTELYTAEEAFFCGSGKEVTPIGSVDHRPVGNGKLGPWTEKIRATYFDVAKGRHPEYAAWLLPVY